MRIALIMLGMIWFGLAVAAPGPAAARGGAATSRCAIRVVENPADGMPDAPIRVGTHTCCSCHGHQADVSRTMLVEPAIAHRVPQIPLAGVAALCRSGPGSALRPPIG